MRKETTITTVEILCDNCQNDLTHRSKDEIVQREIILTDEAYGLTFVNNDWMHFCDVQCANAYLKKQHGIRYVYDDEWDCPKEGRFCRICPQFNNHLKLCNDSHFWENIPLSNENECVFYRKGELCPVYNEAQQDCLFDYSFCELTNYECEFKSDIWHGLFIIPWGAFE